MSAKFCQNCKKTYTDPAATFCEECGADLVPLAAESTGGGEEVYEEGFEEPPVPLWRKYLPMGIALAVVVLVAIILPGIIKDNITNNLSVDLNTERLSTALGGSPPKLALKVKNGGWFSIKIESVKFEAFLLGAKLSSSCGDSDSVKEIPSNDQWTNLDVPLCVEFDILKGRLDRLADFGASSVSASLTAKVLGMTVRADLPSSAVLSDDVVKNAFRLKPHVADPNPNQDPKPRPTAGGGGGGGAHKPGARDNDIILCPDNKTPKPPAPATCKDVMGTEHTIKKEFDKIKDGISEEAKKMGGRSEKDKEKDK